MSEKLEQWKRAHGLSFQQNVTYKTERNRKSETVQDRTGVRSGFSGID
jgi:hypothetical protein